MSSPEHQIIDVRHDGYRVATQPVPGDFLSEPMQARAAELLGRVFSSERGISGPGLTGLSQQDINSTPKPTHMAHIVPVAEELQKYYFNPLKADGVSWVDNSRITEVRLSVIGPPMGWTANEEQRRTGSAVAKSLLGDSLERNPGASKFVATTLASYRPILAFLGFREEFIVPAQNIGTSFREKPVKTVRYVLER